LIHFGIQREDPPLDEVGEEGWKKGREWGKRGVGFQGSVLERGGEKNLRERRGKRG